MATCSEFMEKYADARENSATRIKYSKDTQRCREEAEIVQKYEDSANFAEYNRMMRDAKDIRVEV